MSCSCEFSVRRVGWDEAGDLLRSIRRAVFVEEQNVPEELEWDGLDDRCIHVLAVTDSGEAVGAGRLLPDGHIGRMAVLKHWRGRGVGGAMLEALIAAALETGHASAVLNAQTQALGFYARYGFEAVGGEFMDAGIPHRTMRLSLVRPKRR